MVLVPKFEKAIPKIVVVALRLMRIGPTLKPDTAAPGANDEYLNSVSAPGVVLSTVALLWLMLASRAVMVVVPARLKFMLKNTSQSPAVREMLVMLAAVPVESETEEPHATELEMVSPTQPAQAVSFAAVPGIWPIEIGAYQLVCRPVVWKFPKPSVVAVLMKVHEPSVELTAKPSFNAVACALQENASAIGNRLAAEFCA